MAKRLIVAVALAIPACWLILIAEDVEAQSEGVFSAVEPTLARANPRWWTEPTADATPRTLRSRLVRIDFGRLDAARAVAERSPGDRPPLTLNLFDDAVFVGWIEWSAQTQSGYVLSGHLDGEPFGTVTLVVNGAVVAGTVRTLQGTWRIRSAGAGLHLIRQVDLSTLPPEGEPLFHTVRDAGAAPVLDSGPGFVLAARGVHADALSASEDDPVTDDGSVVDVMVLHTPAARRAEGTRAEIEALIDLLVAETNQAYVNSGVIQRVNLVHREEVAYIESGDDEVDLWRLTGRSDGHLDGIHPLRDAYAADIVHLVLDRRAGDGCGRAHQMLNAAHYEESIAFSVTAANCGAFIFAHELGHNMGLRHDRYTWQDINKPYPYSAGYVNLRAFDAGAPASSRWYTVMAYLDRCTNEGGFRCSWLFRFSNPDQKHHGDPLGVPGSEPSDSWDGPADARRSLNNTRSVIANYRSSHDRLTCKPALAPERQFVAAGGGTFKVAVTIRHDCAWTAAPEAEFVSVTRGASGTGPGVVEYRVAANGGQGRASRLNISGRSILIEQPGPGSEGVCGRTQQVHRAITDAAPVDHCWQVTDSHLAGIHQLNPRNKHIRALRSGDFAGLSGLRSLELIGNDLTTLPAGIFAGLADLENLHLGHNPLTSLRGDVFAGLSSLKRLSFHHHSLTSLPPGVFAGLARLESLVAADGRLTALPEDIFAGLSSLKELWLSGNNLTALPPSIFAGLSSLEGLLVGSNKLTSLPEEIFAGLSNLDTLWLNRNDLSSLPPAVFRGLSGLDNLRLPHNPLGSLPERLFAGLSNLGFLDLYGTGLTALPSGIFADLTALRGLWLTNNKLTALPAGVFSGLSKLRNLELDRNPGSPFTLTLRLVAKQRTSTGGAVAVEVVEGAPFSMTLGLSATGGTLSARSATVGAGQTASPNVTVTREESTATVRPGQPPSVAPGSGCGLPRCFTGLRLAVGGSVEFTASN